MKSIIYADNAATTKLDYEVFETMKPFLLDDYSNAFQPYSFSRGSKKALKKAREDIAECINASPDEIYFTSGGTESDNWAIKGLVNPNDKRIFLTSEIEHHAILNTCKAIEKFDYPVKYLPVTRTGVVTPEVLESNITTNTKLVSIMLVNNEIGTIEPIAELSKIAHEHGAIFHTDAVQAVGHMPIDVKALGIDMLSASGHKFNAPKGIGFLYVRKGLPLSAYENGGSQEFGMRAGTENIASIVAMAKALKLNCEMIPQVHIKLKKMENDFITALKEANVDFIRNGDENHIPGNINISIKNISGEMLLHRLDLKGICISTGSACDSVNMQVSHVIKSIGVPTEYANGTIRISFGKDNDETDAIKVAQEIVNIIK